MATHASGALAKAAKKALYRLKSAGVAAPAIAIAPSPPVTPVEREERFPSLVSPVLGDGERALVVARSFPQGVLTWEVVFSDESGLSSVDGGELSRSEYRRHVKTLRQGQPAGRAADPSRRVVEIPYAEALQLLAQAAAQNQHSGAPLPASAEAMFRRLDVTPAPAPAALPLPLPEDASLTQEGQRLHQEPEIWQWLPPEEELRKLAVAVDELARSPLQLTEVQRAEQLTQRVHAAVDRFFTPPLRELYARRLWAMGDFFERSERPEAAARSRAVARRLFHVGAGDAFTRFLFEKVLRLSAAQHAAGARPGRAPQPPSVPGATPVGKLILPGT